MTLDVVREGLLRAKRDELTSSVLSRKRKLRELYAVARSAEPIPSHPGLTISTPFDDGEPHFLEANDLLHGRIFDESTLPPRHHYVLRSDTRSKQSQSPSSTVDASTSTSLGLRTAAQDENASHKINEAETGEDGSLGVVKAASSPSHSPRRSGRSNRGSLATIAGNKSASHVSKASEDSDVFNSDQQGLGLPMAGVEAIAAQNGLEVSPDLARRPAVDVLEKDRVKRVESPPESPGVNPNESIPMATEDFASSKGPAPSAGAVSSSRNGAATVRLPSKQDQEQGQKERAGVRSNPPPAGKAGATPSHLDPSTEVASSPSSAAGQISCATPGVNEASPDTSPDQEEPSGDVDRLRSKHSPQALRNAEATAQKSDSQSLSQPQSTASERSPSTAEAQLRFEEEQAKLDSVNKTSSTSANMQETLNKTVETSNGEGMAQRKPAESKDLKDQSKTASSDLLSDLPMADGDGFCDQRREGLSELSATGMTGEVMASPEKLPTPSERPAEHADIQMPDAGQMSTPLKGTPPFSSLHSPPERMTTRVSSGAIRHKSVSEILGETPKPHLTSQGERNTTDRTSTESSRSNSLATGASLALDSSKAGALIRVKEIDRRDRSKLSTVIFSKQRPGSTPDSLTLIAKPSQGMMHRQQQEEKDYLLPLFTAQTSTPPRSQPLAGLLGSAHKTLTTPNHYVHFHEQQDCMILKRIYQLQYANKWSLRQIERSVEPDRSATHWDVLLDHMRWMRTDFREEKKWKVAAAKNLASWCAEWVASDPQTRPALQVARRAIRPKIIDQAAEQSDDMQLENSGEARQHTPDLVHSTAEDTPSDAAEDDGLRLDLERTMAPAALFALPAHSVAFAVDKTPMSDNLLQELPLYEASQDVPLPEHNLSPPPDTVWKAPMVPISKYATGKVVSKEEALPSKRSRFDYEEEEEDASYISRVNSMASSFGFSSTPHPAHYDLAPEQNDVALFNPTNKHIRDRIHAGHAFRPPSEQAMPSQNFFESRHSSQWLWTEDDELRALVKEYSYNWSLISSTLASRSVYSSAAERRTPWECFERWVSLEGLPADMQKTQYFRAYHSRLEAAQRHLMSQHQPAQQQQQGQGNNAATPIRRRTSQPVRVERRKNTKYLAMIDAMRKLAKKRETSIQKQQHAAGLAAMRKANVEATQPRAPVHTPQDFSRMKHEREVKIQERMQERAEAYRQSVIAQQRAAMQQRSGQHAGQQSGAPNGVAQQPNAASGGPAGAPIPQAHANAMAAAAQSRMHPAMPGQTNGLHVHGNGPVYPSMSENAKSAMKGMPSAQMQGNMPGQQRPQPGMQQDMRLLVESNRIQQEQRRFLQQQQQQHQQQGHHQFPNHQQPNGQGGPSSSPNMNNVNAFAANASMQANPAVLAAFQAASGANGMSSPPTNGLGLPGRNSASPRMAPGTSAQNNVPQPLSSGMVPAINAISHQIKARHPGASPEQIQRMTSEQLTAQYQQRMSQSAMNAAAGSVNTSPQMAMLNGGGGVPNQQLYAHMIRAQQASQSRAGSAGPNGGRPPSRSATPQNQRSGSVQVSQGANQSPRPPQAQMAGGQ